MIVTRTEAQGAALVAALGARGVVAECIPTIELAPPADPRPLDSAIARLDTYDWLVFTSANAVERFFARAAELGPTVSPARARIAAIGPATRDALAARGVEVDVIPGDPVAEGLVDALLANGRLDGARVLVPRAAVGRDVLPDSLRAAGAEVELVEVYRTVVPEASRVRLVRLLDVDATVVVCASSSTVRNFRDLVGGERAARAALVCAGPVTTVTANELGLRVAATVPAYSLDAVVDAVLRVVASERAG